MGWLPPYIPEEREGLQAPATHPPPRPAGSWPWEPKHWGWQKTGAKGSERGGGTLGSEGQCGGGQQG